MSDSTTHATAVSRSVARRLWFGPAMIAALGVAVVACNGFIRNGEAVITAHVLGLLTGEHTWVMYPQHTLYWHSNVMVGGVEVTAECSSALLIGPLLLAGAAMIISGRFPRRRIGIALALACPLLFLLNLVRLVSIAWASSRWSYDGFNWAHTVAGALLGIAAVTVSVGVFLLILLYQGRRDRTI
jgi:exosortase/archaeosortase family protein